MFNISKWRSGCRGIKGEAKPGASPSSKLPTVDHDKQWRFWKAEIEKMFEKAGWVARHSPRA